jgi:hypothetical protein
LVGEGGLPLCSLLFLVVVVAVVVVVAPLVQPT